MAKTSLEIIRNFISENLVNYDRTVLEQKDNKHAKYLNPKNTDVLRLPTGEEVVVFYENVNITGSDRNNPQIRIYPGKAKDSFAYAKKEKMRFFFFTIFSKESEMVKAITQYDPHEFLVSIETDVESENSRRDLRSMYGYLQEYMQIHGETEYIRCKQGDHNSGISQASFIKISDNGVPRTEEFIQYLKYFDNRPYMSSQNGAVITENETADIEVAFNRIVYGAPGTGKSYYLNRESKIFGSNMERVTFHPNYSYAQFVGTYKPIKKGDDITYDFVPGPFMRVYSQAIQNPDKKYLILIEEINRANVASVFGDVFQLLDRNNGISEYPIGTSEDVKKHLLKELYGEKEYTDEEKNSCSTMSLPKNMYIWATMNSADQGVFPMDTAFKRRWEFQYIGVNDEEQVEVIDEYYIPMCIENTYYIKWQDLRSGINNILSGNECKANEDKLLGPFFIAKNALDEMKHIKEMREKIDAGIETELTLEKVRAKEKAFIKSFESKVLMYLFEDVMKMRPKAIFKGYDQSNGKMIFSEICKAFEREGEKIFGIDLKDKPIEE